MRTIAFGSLLLVSGMLAVAQAPKNPQEQAPPPGVDQALRERVTRYYQAFVEAKYKDAYVLVDDDSQDAFLAADKEQYKACNIATIAYSDNFTKATVVESCTGEWIWHGHRTPSTFPVTSVWKAKDGKWFWTYVRPTQMPFPFSPTGFITIPQNYEQKGASPRDASSKDPSQKDVVDVPGLPKDLHAATLNILSKVSVDKETVRLLPDKASQDVVRIHNGMPGEIRLSTDSLATVVPGLKISLAKNRLSANEETTLTFDYTPTAKVSGVPLVVVHVSPTGQDFNITILFSPPPSARPFKVPPQPQN
jgi:hypothetical protein